MVPIKFQTSANLVYGVYLDSPAALDEFKAKPYWIEHPNQMFNQDSFDIDEDLEWYEGMVLVDTNGEETLRKMGYSYHRLRIKDMYVKMELGDPFYGEPEWKAFHLDSSMEKLTFAIAKNSGMLLSQMIIRTVDERLETVIKGLEDKRSRLDPYDLFQGEDLPAWIDKDCAVCGDELYANPDGACKAAAGWICGECKNEEE